MVYSDPMLPSTSRAKMAADSNMGFHHGVGPSSSYHRQVVSYQPGAMNSTAGMVPGVMNSSGGFSAATGMMMAGNPSVISNASPVVQAGSSSRNILPDPVPGLRCDPGVSVDWSFEEQTMLREGLAKYAGLPTIMKYIKVAAMLREKTVRDVALRCRWMNRKENCKRRKPEERHAGKKIKDGKEKMADVSPNAHTHMFSAGNSADYSPMMHQVRPNYQFPNEAPVIDPVTQQLIDENARLLLQISANFASMKIEDNVDLFNCMRNNITTILNSMSVMPGIISQMPPFPEPVNQELVNDFHGVDQALMLFGTQGNVHSRQDPTC